MGSANRYGRDHLWRVSPRTDTTSHVAAVTNWALMSPNRHRLGNSIMKNLLGRSYFRTARNALGLAAAQRLYRVAVKSTRRSRRPIVEV